jgi:sporulation protein YlmC with PRC-barrel domain
MNHLMRAPSLEIAGPQAWLASRLLRRQVVDVSSIESVGRVADVIFDPRTCQVMALIVESNAPAQGQGFAAMISRTLTRRRELATIGLNHVIALDGDVVMVNADPFQLSVPREVERMRRLNDSCELAILTMRGTCLGALADLMLDERGVNLLGYVVNPTRQGERMLPPMPTLSSLDNPPVVVESQSKGDAPSADLAVDGPPTHLRVIPASSNVHVSESLILLVTEVEPLREEVVIITRQPEERAEPNSHS